MKRKPHRTCPLAAMAANNPASAAELAAGIEKADMERALTRAMALGHAPSQPVPTGDRFATGLRRDHGWPRAVSRRGGTGMGSRRFTLGVGFCLAAGLAALLVFSGWLGGSGSGRPEFAAAAIRVAEANPRLLVTAPGWKIVRADEFEPDIGELAFSDGSHSFGIRWYPARLYERYLRDRADVSRPEHGTLLGQRATTVEYSPVEYATMLSPQGSVFIEVRGRLDSKSAYDEILHALQPVDVETWLSAMPPSTVRPEARSETVDQMLRGIPLPPDFDLAMLQSEDSISDQSSLAVKVGNAVACGWVKSWIGARAVGDNAAAKRAVVAMASSGNWPVVRMTRRTKVPWFSNYAIVTKQLRAGRLDRSPSGYEVQTNGRTFGFGPAWKLILGCGGTYRREVDNLPQRP